MSLFQLEVKVKSLSTFVQEDFPALPMLSESGGKE